jgi:enterochelin esterase-like enzyme
MRRLLFALAVLAVAPELVAQEGGGGDRRRGFGGRRRERDTSSVVLANVKYQRVTFATESLTSKSANYGVYLPPGYDDPANAARKYPWIVWLHGMSEDDRDFHFGGAKVLDEQVGAGTIPPLVFIAAAAPSRTLYANGETEGNVRDLVTKDLLADVKSKFRVSDDRAERAVMGVSLGGMAALRFAFSDPMLFGCVATHSAAVFPEDPTQLPEQHAGTVERFGDRLGWNAVLGNPIDPERYKTINPTCLAHSLGDLHGLRIYFDAGTEDRYGFGPANQHLDEVLTESKIPHVFRLIEGGQHSWGGGTVQVALVESLKFVAAGFPKADPPKPAAPKSGAPAPAPAEKKGEPVKSGG